MSWIKQVRRRFDRPRSRRDVEGEVDAELQFHITAYVEDLMRRGHSEEDARLRALREFGDVTAARAELVEIDRRRARRVGRSDLLIDLGQDVRFGLRSLARRPLLAILAVVTLALGIGGTTAIFSVVDGVLIRELPYRDASSLVSVWRAWPSWRGEGLLDAVWDHIQFDLANYRRLRDNANTLGNIEAHTADRKSVV